MDKSLEETVFMDLFTPLCYSHTVILMLVPGLDYKLGTAVGPQTFIEAQRLQVQYIATSNL